MRSALGGHWERVLRRVVAVRVRRDSQNGHRCRVRISSCPLPLRGLRASGRSQPSEGRVTAKIEGRGLQD